MKKSTLFIICQFAFINWQLTIAQIVNHSVTLNGYIAMQPDAIGFNLNAQVILNPWSSSNNYTNMLQTVSPGIIRYPGGTVANYWDVKNDISLSHVTYSLNTNYNNGWIDGLKTQGNVIKNNNQKYNTLSDLKVGYNANSFAVTYDLNMITPGKDYYAWKWGRTINDHPGSNNMNDDWWLMMKDRLQRNLNMLRRADSLGLPVKYIELGNELYADIYYYLEAFPNDGASYFVAAKYFAQQIKALYPTIKIAAVAANPKDGLNTDPRKLGWNAILLDSISRPLIDNLILHVYCQGEAHATFNSNSEFWNNLITYKQLADSSQFYAQPLFTNNWKIWYTEIGNPTHNDLYTYTWGNSLISAYSYFYFLAHPNTEKVLFQQFKSLLDTSNSLSTIGAAVIAVNQAAYGMNNFSQLQFSGITTVPSTTIDLVQGFAFNNGGQTNFALLNLDSVSHTINLQNVIQTPTLNASTYANSTLSSTITPALQNNSYSNSSVILPAFSTTLIKTLNTSGIHELKNNISEILIYPNPSTGLITFDYSKLSSENFSQFNLYNVFGEKVYSEMVDNSKKQLSIDLKNLSSGVYTSILIGKHKNCVNKIVKQ